VILKPAQEVEGCEDAWIRVSMKPLLLAGKLGAAQLGGIVQVAWAQIGVGSGQQTNVRQRW
jgi:hypothetical protein